MRRLLALPVACVLACGPSLGLPSSSSSGEGSGSTPTNSPIEKALAGCIALHDVLRAIPYSQKTVISDRQAFGFTTGGGRPIHDDMRGTPKVLFVGEDAGERGRLEGANYTLEKKLGASQIFSTWTVTTTDAGYRSRFVAQNGSSVSETEFSADCRTRKQTENGGAVRLDVVQNDDVMRGTYSVKGTGDETATQMKFTYDFGPKRWTIDIGPEGGAVVTHIVDTIDTARGCIQREGTTDGAALSSECEPIVPR